MRFISGTVSALVISGATMLAVVPAFAGPDEAHQDSFWSNQSAGAQSRTQGQYLSIEPRDSKATADTSQNADASNAYFNHAEGTMTGPDAAAPAPSASTNGQYVASYHQYLPVEPRDQKVNKGASGSQDDNIYYYHSEGTMSHP